MITPTHGAGAVAMCAVSGEGGADVRQGGAAPAGGGAGASGEYARARATPRPRRPRSHVQESFPPVARVAGHGRVVGALPARPRADGGDDRVESVPARVARDDAPVPL